MVLSKSYCLRGGVRPNLRSQTMALLGILQIAIYTTPSANTVSL